MSKYIPKVGEAFEYCHYLSGDWIKCGEVKAVTELQIAFIESDGLFAFISRENEFRPIPTKSDVEREFLMNAVCNYHCAIATQSELVNKIQKAGFTILKKVKRSDVLALISDWTDLPNVLTNEICNLLGDLVEQDDIGGAE